MSSPYGGPHHMPTPEDTYAPTSGYGISNPTVADSPYASNPYGTASSTATHTQQPMAEIHHHHYNSASPYGTSNLNLPPGVIPVSVPHSGSPSPVPMPPASLPNDSSLNPSTLPPGDMEAAGKLPKLPVYNKYSYMTQPDKRKEVIRFVQVLASVGSIGFLAGAKPRSGHSNPFDDQSPTNYQYFVAGLSTLVSLFFFLSFFWRFKRVWSQKHRCWGLFLADFFMALFWVSCIVALFIKNHCPVGTLDGWCDFYNTSLFFSVLAAVCYLITLGWDVVAFLKSRRK
ncbi:hypothetical protein H4R33_006049 [Dimargaris cristalligena]|uniref:MARVEL domain-containing protein n=1 Tax=Dimargaris cristalligena TaxID=215637 RepID=A0A4P9ZS06_9FUNG|nr:hypothetical protein H4R33_006049 [Dimargaris cristalligena]RKP35561.1 hypothetical protein BJ085DRAFT_37056 [Dimargaris cristalligena]|eukprot:RKP35561.1 hypothetical protein BJ085DRAFT_37056 [Dimargaris cristalligena]